MYIEVEEQGTIKIFGKLDSANMSELKERLSPFLFTKNELVLDLTEVSQLDFSCIYMLCQLKKKAQKDSKEIKVLLNETSNLSSILDESELKTILD